jgi:hypothetical protein
MKYIKLIHDRKAMPVHVNVSSLKLILILTNFCNRNLHNSCQEKFNASFYYLNITAALHKTQIELYWCYIKKGHHKQQFEHDKYIVDTDTYIIIWFFSSVC